MTQKEISARFYRSRVEKGLCPKCGKPAPEGHLFCDYHRKIATENTKADRAFYKSIGICPNCRKRKLWGEEKQCISCRQYFYERRKPLTEEQKLKIYSKRNEKRRKQHAERIAQGICTRCGKLKAKPGYKKCGICLDKEATRNRMKRGNLRQYWLDNNLCYQCGGERDRPSKMCSKCAAKLGPRTYDRSNHPWKKGN